jgi:WD40 repeat protein
VSVLRVWDVESGEPLAAYTCSVGETRHVQFGSDSDRLATLGVDVDLGAQLKLWNLASDRPLRLPEGGAHVPAVAVAPDGTHMLTARRNLTARMVRPDGPDSVRPALLDASSIKVVATLPATTRFSATAAGCSPDGAFWALGGGGNDRTPGTLRIFDSAGKQVTALTLPPGVFLNLRFSPDGKWLAAAVTPTFGSGEFGLAGAREPIKVLVRVWEVAGWREGRTLENAGGLLAFSHDGRWLATGGFMPQGGSWSNRLDPAALPAPTIFDLQSGKPVLQVPAPPALMTQLAFTPDNQRLLASAGEAVTAWDSGSGEPVVAFTGHKSVIHAMAVHPDGHRLATGAEDGSIKVWDLTTGLELLTLRASDSAVFFLEFCAQGRRLASAAQYDKVHFWDAAR